MSLSTDPRLVEAKPPSTKDVAKSAKGNLSRLGVALIGAIKAVFPSDLNITFTATQYNGHWKVEFKLPAIKESGYRD